ncbi:MAG: aromatic ring-hydroxylating oxygenase subunit alpha [Acidimicrobiales bacterium]
MTATMSDGPVAEATEYLLPPEAYRSPEWYAREQRELFAKTWNLVGYIDDVPRPGDWCTAQIADEPVLLVHGHDGTIRAFLNMCRHRGMAVAEGSGCGAERIRCPYHGWEFGLDGALERIPQRGAQFPDVDAGELGLIPMGCGTWAGLIFAIPQPDAGPGFDEWLADYPTTEFSGDFPWDDVVEISRTRWELACNWKLYVENHIDCYHLWYLHEDSLAMYDHHALTQRSTGLHWACDEPERPSAEIRREGLPFIVGAGPAEERTLRANLLFPNVPMTSSGQLLMTYQVIPTGPESCILDLRIRALPGTVLGQDVLDGNRRVLYEEDGFACEQMQRVARSPRFAVGPLASVHERPIMQFHENILRFLR